MLDGYVNAEIRARVRGFLKSQQYKDGARVKSGPAAVHHRFRRVRRGGARRKAASRAPRPPSAQPRLLERSQTCSRRHGLAAGPRRRAHRESRRRGQVQAAEPALEHAELNLSYTQIRSPIDGVAGVALVRVGNLVGQDGPTLLTTVSQLDPMRVRFPLSEIEYVQRPASLQAASRVATWLGASASSPADERGSTTRTASRVSSWCWPTAASTPHRGVIVAADRQIDPSTGTIQLAGAVPEPRAAVAPRPVRARAHAAPRRGTRPLVVPEKSLILGAGHVLARRGRRGQHGASCGRVEVGASAWTVSA